jgi:hypothetical protein
MDFVLPWVNGSDPEWRELFYQYKDKHEGDKSEARFRDWNNLQYWFRGVEKYAPWVNTIHFITWGHLPDWLNTNHPKLNIVKHEDYIPSKYLPTFNARTIELNLHRIKGLDEQYVFFNDDMFIIDDVHEQLFFRDGKPCDMAVSTALSGGFYDLTLLSNLTVINRRFNKLKAIKQEPFKWFNWKYGKYNVLNLFLLVVNRSRHTGFTCFHFPQAQLKQTLALIWEKEYSTIDEACRYNFRNYTTINTYLHRYWELATNNFYPINRTKLGKLFPLNKKDLQQVIEFIANQKKPMLCLNDNNYLSENIDKMKKEINNALQNILPERSSFEK